MDNFLKSRKQPESNKNIIRSEEEDNREMGCQHSSDEAGSKASLHMGISVTAFSSTFEKSTLLGGIKLAD